MHIKKSAKLQQLTNGSEAITMVLREARRLHREMASESLAQSLPVLRRLLRNNTLPGISLPELHRQRGKVQRKHLLQTLAVEAGFGTWEKYRIALANMSVGDLEHFDIVRRQAGYPNLWFSTHAEAQDHASKHGGRSMRVGNQAVVLIDL
jgi:hypothetical protein